MPTLIQARNFLTNWIDNRAWPWITGRQDFYYHDHEYEAVYRLDGTGELITGTLTGHGAYWQGLITHSDVPAYDDSNIYNKVADRLASYPTDQTLSWLDVIPPAQLARWQDELQSGALRLDVYDGPAGKGYNAHFIFKHNDNTYVYNTGFGPYADNVGWYQAESGTF